MTKPRGPVRLNRTKSLSGNGHSDAYNKLTIRQRRFAEEYVIDYNATGAALRAGYASSYANRQGYQLMAHPDVAAYIDELTQSKTAKIMSVDPEYVIARVTEIITKEGAKDADKLRGLELLAKHLGMFTEKVELTGKDGEAIQIEQRKIEEEAQSFTNLIKSMHDREVKTVREETLQ